MKYKGFYTYNDEKHATEFELIKHNNDTIYGEGKDEGGNYSIDGTLQKSGRLDLKKYYMGGDSLALFGRYIKKNNNVEKLYGCWELKDIASGDFEYILFK